MATLNFQFLDEDETAAACELWNARFCAEDRTDLEAIGLRAYVVDASTCAMEVRPAANDESRALFVFLRAVAGDWSPLPPPDVDSLFEETLDACIELELTADRLRAGDRVSRRQILAAIDSASRRNAMICGMLAPSTTASGAPRFLAIPSEIRIIATAFTVAREAICH